MMFRAFLAFCLLAGPAWAAQGDAYSPSPHAIDIPKWFTESFLDLREDIREAARQDKRLLLYFGQDGCPYCKALMKVNFGQPDIAETTRRNFTPIALNLWGDREVTWIDGRKTTEKELARILKVQFTPTLLFFDEKGHVVLRLNGYSPPEKFRVALDYVSGRMEERQSFTDYLAGLPPEKADAVLVAEPFFERGAPDLPRILKSARKPVIVVFERKSCRDCAELHREGFARPEVRRLIGGFSVLQVDLLGERKVITQDGKAASERDWARSLQVVSTPSIVFFDVAGHEVFRAEGYLRPFHLASTLDYVASGAYREEPSFQRFIQKRADTMRAAGSKVDLWE
jgi:thioredoxin-related protein